MGRFLFPCIASWVEHVEGDWIQARWGGVWASHDKEDAIPSHSPIYLGKQWIGEPAQGTAGPPGTQHYDVVLNFLAFTKTMAIGISCLLSAVFRSQP